MTPKRRTEQDHERSLFIAHRLNAIRRACGLTYDDIVILLNKNQRIMLTRTAVSYYFTGRTPLKICMLYRICDVLQFRISDIADEDISTEDLISYIPQTHKNNVKYD